MGNIHGIDYKSKHNRGKKYHRTNENKIALHNSVCYCDKILWMKNTRNATRIATVDKKCVYSFKNLRVRECVLVCIRERVLVFANRDHDGDNATQSCCANDRALYTTCLFHYSVCQDACDLDKKKKKNTLYPSSSF